MRFKFLAAALLSVCCFRLTALAVSIPITNSGFELPVLSDGQFTDRSVPGWVGSNANDVNNFGVYNPTTDFSSPVLEDNNVAYIERGNILQDLSDSLLVGQYTLTLEVGNSIFDPPSPFLVSLQAGGNTIVQANTPNPADGTFATVTMNYVATASDPNLGGVLRIILEDVGFDKATESYFDDVQLEYEPIPEPGPIFLVVTSAMAAAAFRRRAFPLH